MTLPELDVLPVGHSLRAVRPRAVDVLFMHIMTLPELDALPEGAPFPLRARLFSRALPRQCSGPEPGELTNAPRSQAVQGRRGCAVRRRQAAAPGGGGRRPRHAPPPPRGVLHRRRRIVQRRGLGPRARRRAAQAQPVRSERSTPTLPQLPPSAPTCKRDSHVRRACPVRHGHACAFGACSARRAGRRSETLQTRAQCTHGMWVHVPDAMRAKAPQPRAGGGPGQPAAQRRQQQAQRLAARATTGGARFRAAHTHAPARRARLNPPDVCRAPPASGWRRALTALQGSPSGRGGASGSDASGCDAAVAAAGGGAGQTGSGAGCAGGGAGRAGAPGGAVPMPATALTQLLSS
jgi:hypothetical protein